MGAQEEAVGFLQLALLQQKGILGKQVQRDCVHQEDRQAVLVHQPEEPLYQVLSTTFHGEFHSGKTAQILNCFICVCFNTMPHSNIR